MSAAPIETCECPELATPERVALDRRAFIGGVGAAAGAVLAVSVMPLATAHAAPLEVPTAAARRPDAADTPRATDSPDELWDIDDMWGHWPRYAHPIPYARVPPPAAGWEQIDPIDRALVI